MWFAIFWDILVNVLTENAICMLNIETKLKIENDCLKIRWSITDIGGSASKFEMESEINDKEARNNFENMISADKSRGCFAGL